MIVQHAHYAGKKLSTEWGELVCDAEGCLDIKPEQKKFFCDILQFKAVGPVSKSEAKRLETMKAADKEHDKIVKSKEDDGDEVKPVDKERQSRFSKRLKDEDEND